jgi:hypothetical protein
VNDDDQDIIYQAALFPQNHTVRTLNEREISGDDGRGVRTRKGGEEGPGGKGDEGAFE